MSASALPAFAQSSVQFHEEFMKVVLTDEALAKIIGGGNKSPVITSNGKGRSASINVNENVTAVTTVTATDADVPAQTLTYSISGGNDSSKFTINSSTGVLTFVTAPNYEAPNDSGVNNVYDVTVKVSDGSASDTQSIAVTVMNVNESPVITSNGGGSSAAINVAENSSAVTTVTSTDPDVPAQTKTYSISGGADSARFAINSSTGVLTFVTAPNYEAPNDSGVNNVYDVTVQVSDGSLTDTQAIAVTVTPVNESTPVITSNSGGSSATASVDENSSAVTTVTATDADQPQSLTYSITGGADAAKFAINSSTGALTFIVAPDAEAPADAGLDNVYDVTVQVSDGSLTDTQTIAVTVKGLNDSAPVITSNGGGASAAISVAENGTAVTTVTATDADQPQALTYSISDGADAASFAINASTGALTFVRAPDHEAPVDAGANNVYDVTVQVSDGSLTNTQTLAVSVTSVNDNAPVITSNGGGASAVVSVAENSSAVATVTASDADLPADTLTYSIAGGADADKFTLNGGVLTFITAPDAEAATDVGADNVYDVTVQVSDGNQTVTQAIAVGVTSVNDNAPVISSNGGGASATVNVNENSSAVTTVTASDADLPGETLTYSIVGGADAGKFALTGGVLSFIAAADGEMPADANGDNVYDVIVQVSDGSQTDAQAIAVSVTPVNDNVPVITSNGGGDTAAIEVASDTSAVTTVTATDADLPAETITYTIVGGADADKFAIDAGVLTFVAAPNFATPSDAGANNVYDVIVQASDGSQTDTQAIAATVTQVVAGGVDAVMTDYKSGGAQVEALVVNRTNLPGRYELNVIDTDGNALEELASGDLAPNTAELVYGTPTIVGEQNRNVQARVYVTDMPVIEAKDSSFASQSVDSDGDGITDDDENMYGLDPNDPADALQDLDGDGLTNIDEINVHGTYHDNPDSEGDGMNDGVEVQYGLNPLINDANLDLDHDFVTNIEELNVNHTDPSVSSGTVGLDTPEYQQILHVLNRLTFGPTDALIAEVQQMGISNWIGAQLTPIGLGTVGDPTLDPAQVLRDSHSVNEFTPERLGAIRPVHSLKQLQAKMGVFWDNHFNTDVDKDEATEEELYEEDQFFVNAFGNFETLLNISAKSFTMLKYLDLLNSNKNGPNENYAREVMELHTFGETTAGGTYTSTDVNELARILTGFTGVTSAELSRYGVLVNEGVVEKRALVKYGFSTTNHDANAKLFLGDVYPAGVSTVAEAESALHKLAVHPVTARNICTKLAKVFISDTPSESTITDCVSVFLANTTANDQIGQVLQSLFNSTEFNSPATYKVKFKDTQEFMFSLARFLSWSATNNMAAGATLDGNAFGQTIYNAGQPMHHFEEPTGWLEQGELWTTSNVVINRFREGNTMVFNTSKVNLKNYFTSRNITAEKDIVAHLFLVLLGGKYDASHMDMAYWALHAKNAYGMVTTFSINDADAETKLKGLVARIVQLSDYSSH